MKQKPSVRYAWLKIKDDIQDQIYDGTLQPGNRILTVTALAKRHGVSTVTVRQATNELASDGILEVRQGRGTIVALPKRDYDPTAGFAEQADRLGGEPRTEIYMTQWIVPHGDTATALGLRRNQSVWEVSRIHYLNDEPVMFEVTQFVRDVADQFMGETRKLESLFSAFREVFSQTDWHVETESVRLTKERIFSDLLGLGHRTIFFHITRVVVVGGRRVAVSISILRSDRFHLRFNAEQKGHQEQ